MSAQLNTFATILFFSHLVTRATPAVKIWKHDWDIRNPEHWLSRKHGADCNGLVIGQLSYSLFILGDMKIRGLTTGADIATMYLMDGARIEFAEDTTDVLNCVHVTESRLRISSWVDPSNWITKGEEGNVAIPHRERIPCAYDEVEFPKAWLSGIFLVNQRVKIRSLKFGDAYLTNDDIEKLKRATIPSFLVSAWDEFEITWKSCADSDGCLCNSNQQEMPVCGYVDPSTYMDESLNMSKVCSDPVTPIGHCTAICGLYFFIRMLLSGFFGFILLPLNSVPLSRIISLGAVITAKLQHNFNIDFLKHYLKEYTSNTYASKVIDGADNVVQVIFAEQNFTGVSLDEANEFYSRLVREDIFRVRNVRILSARRLFSEAAMAQNVLSIVFGTLCGVVLVFAIVFLVYSPQFSTLNLRNRFSTRPLASYKTNFFAKYDPSEQTGLILRTQSPAQSVVSLDKSFDNPMYGRSTPSTASTSYKMMATSSHEQRVIKSEISLENPMYDLNSIDVTSQDYEDEEELVDLTKKEELR